MNELEGAGAGADLLIGAFAASPLGLMVANASSVVRTANDAIGRLLGRPLEQVLGARLDAFVEASQRFELLDLLTRATGGDPPSRREIRFVRPDGLWRVGGFSVAPMGAPQRGRSDPLAVVVIRDLTEELSLRDALAAAGESAVIRLEKEAAHRRDAEGACVRLQAELRQLVDTVPEMAIIHRRGRIAYVNDVAVHTLGHLRAADLVGRLLLDLADPGTRPLLAERMGRSDAGAPVPSTTVRLRRCDGSLAEIDLVAMPIVFAGEAAQLMLGRDSTERRSLEARLVMTDRLASLGTLAAGVAHEINNPLAYVTSNLDLLAEELRGLAGLAPAATLGEMAAMVGDARQGAQRVGKIVGDLKTLSRPDREERGPVDVFSALEEALKMTSNEIRHRARLVKDWEPLPPIDGDPARLAQVFINLLINAAQAMGEGHVDDNTIHVVTRTDEAGRAVVEIADTGRGVPVALRGRIFDPFFTTKPVGVGTGLGLSICHGIVTSLGGEISVHEGAQRGSVFRVVLPPGTQGGTVDAPQAPPKLASGRRGRLLIVDDDVLVGVGLRRLLGREHDVTLATSGEQGLDLLRAGPAFDVILCDLMLPDMTGMGLHAEVRRSMPGQAERFVFMTGGAFTQSARTFLETVPNPRFDKPFQSEAVRSLIRRLLG